MSELQQVSTQDAPAPGGTYSQAIVHGRSVWTAGQVGTDPATGELPGSLEGQVEQAITNLEAVLAAAGCGLADVVRTTCFLTRIEDFAAFDAVYRRRFAAPFPARSTVGVALAGQLLFEIEASAVRPEAAAG
ncbi:RidA family protein [Pseudonocardia sichuanensis]